MKRYGYHRTSTREQHLDRGITEINAYCSANNLELEMNILVRQSRQSGLSRATIPDERAIRNVMPRKALYMSRHMVSLHA